MNSPADNLTYLPAQVLATWIDRTPFETVKAAFHSPDAPIERVYVVPRCRQLTEVAALHFGPDPAGREKLRQWVDQGEVHVADREPERHPLASFDPDAIAADLSCRVLYLPPAYFVQFDQEVELAPAPAREFVVDGPELTL